MADYEGLDKATLEQMLEDASSYEERSALRQAIRKKKREAGQIVGRNKPRGGSVYNRFAGSTAPKTSSKNFVAQEKSSDTPKKQPKTKTTSPPPPRPHTPTPPPTPEPALQDISTEDVVDEVHNVSPPASPQQPEDPHSADEEPQGVEPQEDDDVDGTPVTTEPVEDEERHDQTVDETADIDEPAIEEPEDPETAPTSHKDESTDGRNDTDSNNVSGAGRFEGVSLRSSKPDAPPPKPKPTKSQSGTVDFGVKLKSSGSPKHSPSHKSEAPKTLRDYQQLSSRAQANGDEGSPLSGDELHKYLVAYVNQELSLSPPLPAKGKALFDTCCEPSVLCTLINKSVSNTVDLRALTKVSSSMSSSQRKEALEENMMLVIESARAIGCRVSESLSSSILEKDPQSIRNFLVDLIRARVVHLPGMEDEPGSTFTNMATLFKKLHISVDTVDGESPEPVVEDSYSSDREKVRKALESPPPTTGQNDSSSTEVAPATDTAELTYEERAARRKAEREQKNKQEKSSEIGLSYEERAVKRKAEREKRKKDREALAH